MVTKKTILLTNDDGIHAEGINALYRELIPDYSVYIVAPDRERSAVSMAISLNHPLRIRREAENRVAVDGTPSDCINVALQHVLPHPPDLVVSGMNQGENLSFDVFYSGTVGAAFTAHLYGTPAMAVSLIPRMEPGSDPAFNFKSGVEVAVPVIKRLLQVAGNAVVYNLNIPFEPQGPVRVTSIGDKRYHPEVVEMQDPRGRSYYWLGSGSPDYHGDENSDVGAVLSGHPSLSILRYDLNCDTELKKLREEFK